MLAMDLGFMGPNYPISTACATGNYCILRQAARLVTGHIWAQMGLGEAGRTRIGLGTGLGGRGRRVLDRHAGQACPPNWFKLAPPPCQAAPGCLLRSSTAGQLAGMPSRPLPQPFLYVQHLVPPSHVVRLPRSAADHIRRGEADLMLAGGSEASIIPSGIGGFIACKVGGSGRGRDISDCMLPRMRPGAHCLVGCTRAGRAHTLPVASARR